MQLYKVLHESDLASATAKLTTTGAMPQQPFNMPYTVEQLQMLQQQQQVAILMQLQMQMQGYSQVDNNMIYCPRTPT